MASHAIQRGHPPDSVRNLEVNVLWDGLFHMSTYIFTALGLYTLWRYSKETHRWSGKLLPGAMLIGFGVFNLVEGIIDHHILGLITSTRRCRASNGFIGISLSWCGDHHAGRWLALAQARKSETEGRQLTATAFAEAPHRRVSQGSSLIEQGAS